MKRTHLLTIVSLCLLLCSCSKSSSSSTDGDNNSISNGFKLIKGSGGGTVNVTYTSVTVGTETNSSGTYFSFRGFFKIGNSIYDRLAISFKTDPAVGTYVLTSYNNLPADKSSANISFDSYNYLIPSGSVKVSIINGKKTVEFSNLVLESGALIPGTTGTKVPDNSVITGSIAATN